MACYGSSAARGPTGLDRGRRSSVQRIGEAVASRCCAVPRGNVDEDDWGASLVMSSSSSWCSSSPSCSLLPPPLLCSGFDWRRRKGKNPWKL
jgi:hypothetical protein